MRKGGAEVKVNEPAYPIQGFCGPNDNVTYPEYGLTKRELAILMAMQGLCAEYLGPQTDWDYDDIASFAVDIADATLAAMEAE